MSTNKKPSKREIETARIEKLRTEKLEQILVVIDNFKKQLQEIRENYKNLDLLESVSLGLYDEVDKLSKKAPVESVTDLMLSQINDVIRETKELASDDSYIQRLNEFVAAGDNPEYRDAVLVLRQLREGLKRYNKYLENIRSNIGKQQREAEYIKFALEVFLEEDAIVDKDDFNNEFGTSPTSWLNSVYPKEFNFERLDKLDIPSHFSSNE